MLDILDSGNYAILLMMSNRSVNITIFVCIYVGYVYTLNWIQRTSIDDATLISPYSLSRTYAALPTDRIELNSRDAKKNERKARVPNWRDPLRLLEFLRAAGLFGLIMLYFYFCDYHKGI